MLTMLRWQIKLALDTTNFSYVLMENEEAHNIAKNKF